MEWNCPECHESYDLDENMPRHLQDCCQQTVCSACIKDNFEDATNNFKCPLCSQVTNLLEEFDITEYPENKVFTTTIKLKEYQRQQTSRAHSSQTFEDKKKSLIQNLLVKYQNLDKPVQSLGGTLDNYHEKFDKLVRARFTQAREELQSKENTILKKFKTYFTSEKSKVVQHLGRSSVLQEDLSNTLAQLDSVSNEKHFNAVKSEGERLSEKLEKIFSEDVIAGYKTVLDQALNQYEQELESVFKHITTLKMFSENDLKEKLDDICFEESEEELTKKRKLDPSIVFNLLNFQSTNDVLIISGKSPRGAENSTMQKQPLQSAKKVFVKLNKKLLSESKPEVWRMAWDFLEKVSQVKISFVGNITDEQINNFPKEIFTKKKLKNVVIDFNCSNKIGDRSIEPLFKSIVTFPNDLRVLKLNLKSIKVTDDSLVILIEGIKPIIKNLLILDLGVPSSDITNEGVKKLFTSMEKMTKLSLDFSNTQINSQTIEAFSKTTLPTLNALEEFELDISSTNVQRTAIPRIFRDMPNLKKFALRLNDIKTSNRDLDYLTERTLPSLQKVEDFQLGLQGSDITDDSLIKIIAKIPAKAKILDLNLEGVKRITNQSLRAFQSKKPAFFETLESLDLNFGATNISDEGISNLFDHKFPNLTFFSLNLCQARNIKNLNTEDKLKKVLKTMTKIESLTLNLSGTQINDDKFAELFFEIKKRKTLTTLHIYLEDLSQISDKSVKGFLVNIVDSLKELKDLKLELKETKVTNEVKTQVQQKISSLRKRHN